MGPEPMRKMLFMSFRLGMSLLLEGFHQIPEFLEQTVGVVRTGRCFRMELDRKDRVDLVLHAFKRAVVQVYVGCLHPLRGERFKIHRKTVILRGDGDLAGGKFFRMDAFMRKLPSASTRIGARTINSSPCSNSEWIEPNKITQWWECPIASRIPK